MLAPRALTSANNNTDVNVDVTNNKSGTYGADTIVFDATLFGSAQTITLNSLLPDITGDTAFQGTTAANVTIARGAGSFRIFNSAVAGTGVVAFSNLTITGGNVTAGGNGAGIFASDDSVTVTKLRHCNNTTTPRRRDRRAYRRDHNP